MGEYDQYVKDNPELKKQIEELVRNKVVKSFGVAAEKRPDNIYRMEPVDDRLSVGSWVQFFNGITRVGATLFRKGENGAILQYGDTLIYVSYTRYGDSNLCDEEIRMLKGETDGKEETNCEPVNGTPELSDSEEA